MAGVVRYNNRYLAQFDEKGMRVPMNDKMDARLMIDYNGQVFLWLIIKNIRPKNQIGNN